MRQASSIDPRSQGPRPQLMFALTLAWLLLLGLLLPQGGAVDSLDEVSNWFLDLEGVLPVLLTLWALIVLETLLGAYQKRDNPHRLLLLVGLISVAPVFRLALSTAAPERTIWLPRLGWQPIGEDLFERVEWALALPMLLITLLIVPVLVVELLFQQGWLESPPLALAAHVTTSLIWSGFCVEFVLLFSITERKLEYCKRNWVNIVIIILPLVAFLRTLRLFRAMRVAKAGRLLRAYRLRGLLTRAQRIALLFNLIERVLHRDPKKHLAKLYRQEQDKQRELERLRAKIKTLEAQVAEDEGSEPDQRRTGVE